jgi:hypothetical protein
MVLRIGTPTVGRKAMKSLLTGRQTIPAWPALIQLGALPSRSAAAAKRERLPR